jgi:hypothetical protein
MGMRVDWDMKSYPVCQLKRARTAAPWKQHTKLPMCGLCCSAYLAAVGASQGGRRQLLRGLPGGRLVLRRRVPVVVLAQAGGQHGWRRRSCIGGLQSIIQLAKCPRDAEASSARIGRRVPSQCRKGRPSGQARARQGRCSGSGITQGPADCRVADMQHLGGPRRCCGLSALRRSSRAGSLLGCLLSALRRQLCKLQGRMQLTCTSAESSPSCSGNQLRSTTSSSSSTLAVRPSCERCAFPCRR